MKRAAVMEVVELRLRVVMDVRAGMPAREAAARNGVSRTQVYEWLARYAARGAQGLAPRSRRPLASPRQLDAASWVMHAASAVMVDGRQAATARP